VEAVATVMVKSATMSVDATLVVVVAAAMMVICGNDDQRSSPTEGGQ
jgi:hypothetical protein